MNLPTNLYKRLLLALAFAGVVIGVLAITVEAFEQGPKPTLRAQPEDAARAAADGASDAPTFAYELLLPRHEAALGFEVTALRGTLAVASRAAAFPPDVAPVVEVLADGSLALRRPKPLASGPEAAPEVSRDGHGAGLVLPSGDLDELSAEARGALCGLLLRWFPDRPFPRERLRPVGMQLPPVELDRLLRWLP